MTLVSAHVRVYNASVGQLYNSEELTSLSENLLQVLLVMIQGLPKEAASCRACENIAYWQTKLYKKEV